MGRAIAYRNQRDARTGTSMIYSYTQISHYLRCPRSYRFRYLDGWREKDSRAALCFGRCFEKAIAAFFEASRRKAYYLMAIHEQLPRIHKVELQQVGWYKATELAKVARRDGQRFDSATWLHKARELPKEEFKREVSKHLTGKETEPWEILYFKAYKRQLPVIEQAIETAGLMLGSDKSRGYCLEMICADFLAGVSLEAGIRDALLPCLTRLVIGLPKPQRKQLLEEVQVTF